jgi:hypothetical protein
MIISRNYAKRLVRQGKATLDGATFSNGPGCGRRYQIVMRHDLHRTDHYLLRDGQFAEVAVRDSRNRLTGRSITVGNIREVR